MNNTSQQYKDAIYAPSRMIHGRVTFDITDTTISTDTITTTVTSEFAVSNKSQLTDKVRTNSYNIATLENNRFKLDGSFTFADDTLVNNKITGWCSNVLCDSAGAFSVSQTLSFVFGNLHSSAGITVTFDMLNNEFASDFDVIAYDGSNNVIYTTSITGNTDVLRQIYGQFLNYKRIDVVIKKWCKPNRRARVSEVDFGIVKVYTDDTLISMNLVEETDLFSATIPSPELKFTVDNSDRAFNILNPSGFYKFLQQKQTISAELGIDLGTSIEYVSLGNYLLNEWTSDEGSLTATLTGRTNLDLMNGFSYSNSVSKSNYSLYQMAVDMFTICGITNYVIDSSLQNILTNGLVQNASCRDILQMIAIAGCANVFVTRSNKIVLKVIPSISANSDTITMNEMYNEAQVDLQKIIRAVNVTYYTDLSTSNIVTANSTNLNGDTLNVENNTLINNSTQASNVANWILNKCSYRAKYIMNWRGNPAHELFDTISMENSYSQNMSGYVTKTELNYEGYLSARTEARGIV